MATPPEQPWSNHEKNYLLAEIIKAAHPSPDLLFNVIRNHNIQPRWEDIPLPPGRSLNSSRFAFDDLRRTLSMQSMGAPLGSNTPLSVPTLKRPYQFEGPYSAGGAGREIRPKPTSYGSVYAQPSPSDPPAKRKRGRPTKAEAQAKAEAAAVAAQSGGGESSYMTAQPSLSRPHAQTPLPLPMQRSVSTAPSEEVKPALPPTTRMPIASILTPTTREEPKSASHSSGSSGKRRRARSTKSEHEEVSPLTRQGADYESPYARVRNAPEDSPARAAVLRHREGFGEAATFPPRTMSAAPGPGFGPARESTQESERDTPTSSGPR